ncbi:5-oxoprolinase/urea amidolyase family protein [Cellulosimicrobium arenosum]|uniref:5-oxoprolinase/urea amidolyase family protein n=1 Tax=Cellulosimicrobium arenosum TaxID=2708133 RepID=A0A927J1H1_9MICO|nr:5-oxoprolinase/urea amidolyase family protein [Cellulosimicrobium arenosum]MBD8080171.1 5-oxoprolinase/urea amidolyase family protein [Cellulosimicrobium arenosum]
MPPAGRSTPGARAGGGSPRVQAFGESAFLVDVADLTAVRALHARLVRDAPVGVADLVPAARTVLVHADGPRAARGVAAWLDDVVHDLDTRTGGATGVLVEIPVVYDGADLPDVAAWAGASVEEVVARHVGRTYDAAFSGFLPGFAYLAGVDPRIAVPRRATPRTRVPAGSVALAGELTAVYPRASPGGWSLLGTTDRTMFDAGRDRPALVRPGDRVRFVRDVRPVAHGQVTPAAARPDARTAARVAGSAATWGDDGSVGVVERSPEPPEPPKPPGRALEVVSAGPLTLVQDRGRAGRGAIGVGRSGAADRASHDLANRLLANPPGVATVEVVLGGLALLAHHDTTLVLTGALVTASIDAVPVGMNAPFRLPAGATLRLGSPARGLRTYVGVRGGVDARSVLGSRSTDTLSGLGPAGLAAGDRLPVGPRPPGFPSVDVAPVPPVLDRTGTRPGTVTLEILPGPRAEWFPPATLRTLGGAVRTVSPDSDRVALRLLGPTIARRPGDLPSEGLVRGAVQVPPDGVPVVFLADHPVTGGYPVLGVLREADADRAAQLRPGDAVRLRTVPRTTG